MEEIRPINTNELGPYQFVIERAPDLWTQVSYKDELRCSIIYISYIRQVDSIRLSGRFRVRSKNAAGVLADLPAGHNIGLENNYVNGLWRDVEVYVQGTGILDPNKDSYRYVQSLPSLYTSCISPYLTYVADINPTLKPCAASVKKCESACSCADLFETNPDLQTLQILMMLSQQERL